MRKNPILFFKIAALLLFVQSVYAAPKLDIGTEYRMRGIQITNPTYGSELPIGSGNTFDQRYYSQRARIYLKAKLDPGIEIGTVLQSIGIAGSTTPLLNRYPREDFTPFVENIYLQANEIYDWPVNLTVGKQPYLWGSGLLISDDGLGFEGIRLDVGPFWNIRSHFLTAKAKDKLVGENDNDLLLAGLSYSWGIHNIKFGWIMEQDRAGTPYSNFTSTIPVATDKISRQFFNLQMSGRLEKGAFYSAEYAMQRGKVLVPGKEFTLSGSAFTFEGGFDIIHPRYKRMILTFIFMHGSGDSPDSINEDEKFNPSYGRKFDGLERSGYGDFFAATPYSFFNEDKIEVVTLRDSVGAVIQSFPYRRIYSGLRMYGFRGSVTPLENASAGLEFYIYTARETTSPTGSTAAIIDKNLGRELVFSGSYLYAKRIQFNIRWGKFFPTEVLNNAGSSRLTFEISGKF